jgi:hypothetical protein
MRSIRSGIPGKHNELSAKPPDLHPYETNPHPLRVVDTPEGIYHGQCGKRKSSWPLMRGVIRACTHLPCRLKFHVEEVRIFASRCALPKAGRAKPGPGHPPNSIIILASPKHSIPNGLESVSRRSWTSRCTCNLPLPPLPHGSTAPRHRDCGNSYKQAVFNSDPV